MWIFLSQGEVFVPCLRIDDGVTVGAIAMSVGDRGPGIAIGMAIWIDVALIDPQSRHASLGILELSMVPVRVPCPIGSEALVLREVADLLRRPLRQLVGSELLVNSIGTLSADRGLRADGVVPGR
jgi:hypothetical protein